MTYAAIDIGSNAARLLIKRTMEAEGGTELRKLLLLRVPLRLGFDVFLKGCVAGKRADNLVRFLKAARQLMKIYEVDSFRAVATSAMRDASNGGVLMRRIKSETGIQIEIIAGEEEAAIVYNNHIEKRPADNGDYLYVDVGGGSTEVNFLASGSLLASGSFNIGTVRLLSGKVRNSEWERLNEFLKPIANSGSRVEVIGSGGNINKLFKMASPASKDPDAIPVEELARLYHILLPLSERQRMERFGLRADRADVIIPAAGIFLHIASLIGAKKIFVPMIGVADGIIDGLYQTDIERKK